MVRSGGGLVSGSRVGSGSGMVGSGVALITDVSDITGVGVGHMIRHDLSAAIGKEDAVLAFGGVPIAGLIGGKVGARIVIGNGIAILIDGGSLLVDRSVTVGGRVGGGSEAEGGEESEGDLPRTN